MHEFQSKSLMRQFDVSVQRGDAAGTPAEALQIASSGPLAASKEYVVKAQILAGGRGKGAFMTGFKGGVHLTNTPAGVSDLASKMLGNTLVTAQTGPGGAVVNKVLVAEAVNITKETYLAILMDRASQGPVILASPQGGMDIEAVAEHHPELIFKLPVDVQKGLQHADSLALAQKLGFAGSLAEAAASQIENLYRLFCATDATQVEINPLAQTDDGRVIAVDAKIQFDDNAMFRQHGVFSLHDPSEDDPKEQRAAKAGLNYIALDGNIGCLVNGAGLAMATMDIIQTYGGSPANFLDVGGSASVEQVKEAFAILTSDPQVKAILVNIFGGIMRCDVIAEGIIKASQSIGLSVPLVVRLEGTNVERGKALLKASGLNITVADDLDDAARKAVASLKRV